MRSFIRIRQVLMYDTAADTHTHKHTHTHTRAHTHTHTRAHTNKQTHTECKNNSLVNFFGSRLNSICLIAQPSINISQAAFLQKTSIKLSKRATCRHGVWVVNAFTTHSVVGGIMQAKQAQDRYESDGYVVCATYLLSYTFKPFFFSRQIFLNGFHQIFLIIYKRFQAGNGVKRQ